MKAAIYARVSSDQQRERHTIGSQLTELPKYAKSQGWTVVRLYQDDGKSGESIDGRPEFQALLEDAEKKLFEIVLVIDLDRITRSKRDQEGAFIYDTFRLHGIKLATPSNGLIDLENEDQDLQIGILQAFAKFEKRKFLRRTMRGKYQAAKDGKRYGSIDPYGYRWVIDPVLKAGGSYQIVEDEAKVVRRIYSLALEGHGVAMIAWMLENEGIRTRPRAPRGTEGKIAGPWWRSSVLKVLHSVTYTGSFKVLKGKESEPLSIKVPPIVTRATWDAAQRALTQRKMSSGAPARHDHLLRGCASCGVCGYKMWIVTPRAGKSAAYYRCCTTNGWRGMGLKGPCGNKHHRVDRTDHEVQTKVLEILQNPKLLAQACSLQGEPTDGVDWKGQLRGLEQKLAILDEAASDAMVRQRRGIIPSAVAEKELLNIARERKLVDRNVKLARVRSGKASAERSLRQNIEDQAKALSSGLDQADFETRRKIITLLLPRELGCGVVLHRDGGIDIKWVLPLPGDIEHVELRTALKKVG
jgi:site-specific DNA recombinase